MELTIAPKDILQINDARIIHRNFEGRGTMYNREGDRNFSVVIPSQEMADKLIELGWNVKIKDPREDGDEPFIFLPVKVSFNGYGPAVYLQSGNRRIELDEETVKCLDDVDVISADMDIRPYDWGPINGKYGRSAYLQSIRVHQRIDRFAAEDQQF
jgi:hypothetical protein